MVSYDPDKPGTVPDPDEIAEQLATESEQQNLFSEKTRECIRTSQTPLAEPTNKLTGSTGSLRSIIRYCVLTEIRDTEKTARVSFSKTADEKKTGITTHPSLLDSYNRLLPQAVLAKAYHYGYWVSGWSTVEGGTLPESVDSDTGVSSEQRRLDLTWQDEYYKNDYESAENWFSDADAVTEFAARVTDDDVPWAEYIPWYRTTAVSVYRLNRVAETTDWDEFPEPPDARPQVKSRFETAMNPPVGEFIRTAVLSKLERSIPTITNLSTGPEPWATDRVSIVFDPTAAAGRPNPSILCPRVVLRKLAMYGYRPIDGWYDAPVVGYKADDSIKPRHLEFARDHTLKTWSDTVRMQSSLFDDAAKLSDYLPGLDWQRFVACAQSQVLTYRDLRELAENPDALF